MSADTCRRGHPLEGDNLYRDKAGRRRCRRCAADNQRAYRQRAAAALREIKALRGELS